MRGALLIAVLLAAAPPPPARDAGADLPVSSTPVLTPSHGLAGQTKCAACHVTGGWSDVRFNHDRTGFALTGHHVSTACKGCHPTDFQRPVPMGCVGCHRDVHAGDLGGRCDGCHDTGSWASRFDADAHRRTSFPLVGGHAGIPCLGCHSEASGRKFARAAVECAACHQPDLERSLRTGLDHTALALTGSCRSCHNAFRFKPALFPAHDACYLISTGSHATVPCLGCHQTLRGLPVVPGTCNTQTARCTACHQCLGPDSKLPTPIDLLHLPPKVAVPVPAYGCADRKCFRCHQQVGVRR